MLSKLKKQFKSMLAPLKLPDYLEHIQTNEMINKLASTVCINDHDNLKEHLQLLILSLDTINKFIVTENWKSDDEISIQLLGIRVMNTTQASLNLLLSGYYHTAYSLHRDILETGFLLDYFSSHPDKISHWRNLPDKEREKEYKIIKLRIELNKRDNPSMHENNNYKSLRDKLYKELSTFVTHPTPHSHILFTNNDSIVKHITFNENFIKQCMLDLAFLTGYSTHVYLENFPNLSQEFVTIKSVFYDKSAPWVMKYIKNDSTKI